MQLHGIIIMKKEKANHQKLNQARAISKYRDNLERIARPNVLGQPNETFTFFFWTKKYLHSYSIHLLRLKKIESETKGMMINIDCYSR